MWDNIKGDNLITITANCHVRCMTFLSGQRFPWRGWWEMMMSLRGMVKVQHTREQFKGAPERHVDRFVPLIVPMVS